ncbi:MAG: glycosyl hydrolase [Acidobacteriaceae bacterium]
MTACKRFLFKAFFLGTLLGLLPLRLAQAQTAIEKLQADFANPPAGAKPMMRWWWFGLAVEKREIRRELEQMKADGIGGVELAFVYPQVVDDPAKGLGNEPFLSGPMLDNVAYAASEGRRLGLRVDVTLGSGWPYGGPATTPAEAAGCLRVAELAVAPGTTSVPAVKLAEGESVVSTSLADGEPQHWTASTEQLLAQTKDFPPSTAPRTALVFIASHTGQQVKRAAVGAEGWVLDPFSHQAVATHLRAVGEPLVKAFGSAPPYAVFSDSLEAYGADWTPDLPAEFKRRRGYDLLPHLPELVAGGSAEAEKVRHDWGKTLTELVDENYLTQIHAWADAHLTKFRSQTYGEPAVSLSSQNLVDLAEGEGPHWRAFSTLRWATSANHLFHHNVTSAETFTWLHSPAFRATPLDMKAEVDLHFLIGVNQVIGHGWPYSPPQAGEPGWSLYAAAVFNDHNPWHPVMPDVTRYIERTSFLLRQGQPANQVAVLLPTDDAWARFSPGKVSVTSEMDQLITPALMSSILSAGYNADYIDADAVEKAGIHYPVLVIPPTDRIPGETLLAIQRYVAGGGKVIAVGRAPSLNENGESAPDLSALSRQIFDQSKSALVADPSALADALHRAIPADFKLDRANDDVGFIRRKLPDADIYFVANTANHSVSRQAAFATTHKFGQRWDADTGTAVSISGPTIALSLAPYESAIFVFSDEPAHAIALPQPGAQIADLSAGWKVTFTGIHKTMPAEVPADWTSDPATRFYSGEAVYEREFTLSKVPGGAVFFQAEGGVPTAKPEVSKGPGMRAWYDPPVREAAIVFVNGHRVGSLWHPPYRLAVDGFLKQGQNEVVIKVYNTAMNAWASLPPHDYKPLIAKYGDRFQMQDLDQVKPVPSGLLGTIHLVGGEAQ